MRSNWTWTMAPLACAAILIGCGGNDGVEHRRANAGTPMEQSEMITLTGCVQSGPATDQLVLQNVQAEAEQPAGDPAASRDVITEGSWVRLTNAGAVNLDQYVGQEVRVTGTLLDSGESPTGTAGYETPSGDRSTQAEADRPHADRKADEAGPIGQASLATGRSPELQVHTLNATGRPCTDQEYRRQ